MNNVLEYLDDLEETETYVKTKKKNHRNEYSKEYNGKKSKKKNHFKKMRDKKYNYDD